MSSPLDDLARALGPETTALIEKLIAERLDEHRSAQELFTVSQFAKKIGKSERSVRARIERGQLRTVKVGHSVFIRPE